MVSGRSQQASKKALHWCNEVTLVWGSLRLTPITVIDKVTCGRLPSSPYFLLLWMGPRRGESRNVDFHASIIKSKVWSGS